MVDLRADTRENPKADDKHVRAVATRLAEEFGRSPDDLEGRVRSEFSRWDHARVTQFVPVFVERRVRNELRGR
ncbi:MAG: hypothetical protein QOI55_1158 [Actinomycetota bacterium]|jgi:hypothetical protein|nr:hypothetical protein [Actinomycetota bacterium]